MSKVYVRVPLYAVRVKVKGSNSPEEVFRHPLIFRTDYDAYIYSQKVMEESGELELFSIVQSGWYCPESGRVFSCKKREVFSSEKGIIPEEIKYQVQEGSQPCEKDQ